MRRIIGVVVCGARALRSGAREAYIYELAEEGCPRGSQFGDPSCERYMLRTLDYQVAGASDYRDALVRVLLPADAEGLAALEAARPGAIFEVAGQRDHFSAGRGVREEVEFEGAKVTPLPGPAPREALRALEIPAFEVRNLPGGVPAVVRGGAATPVRESGHRVAAAWFLLEFPGGRRQAAIPVVLFGRRADELPALAPGAAVRAACVRRELIDPLDERLPAEAREALFPGRSPADLPYSIEVLFGGPQSAVMIL
jgi:hypothetical protein